MSQPRRLPLMPDWPRVRQLVAKHLEKSEDEVQAMMEKGDSLDKVDLELAIEEVLEKIRQSS